MGLPGNATFLRLLSVASVMKRITGCALTTVSGIPGTLPPRGGCYARSFYRTSNGDEVFTSDDSDVQSGSALGVLRSQHDRGNWTFGTVEMDDPQKGTARIRDVVCVGTTGRRRGWPWDVTAWTCDMEMDGRFTPAEKMSVSCGCSGGRGREHIKESRLRRRRLDETETSSDQCDGDLPRQVSVNSQNFSDVNGVYTIACDSTPSLWASWYQDGVTATPSIVYDSGAAIWSVSTSDRKVCQSAARDHDPTSIATEDWQCDENNDGIFSEDERGDFEGVTCYESASSSCPSSDDEKSGAMRDLEEHWLWSVFALVIILLLACMAHFWLPTRPKSRDAVIVPMAVEDAYPPSPSAVNPAWEKRSPPKLPEAVTGGR